MNTTNTTGLKPLAETHVHESVVRALELLIQAKSILSSSYKEAFEPSPDEINLLRTARTEDLKLHTLIHQLSLGLDRTSLPVELDRALFRRTGEELLKELHEGDEKEQQALREKHKDGGSPLLMELI